MSYQCKNTNCRLMDKDVQNVGTGNRNRCISCRRPLIFVSDPLDNFDDAGKQMADRIDAEVLEEVREDETPGVCGDSVINTESEGLKNLMSSRVPSKSLLARDKAKAKKEFLDLTSAPAPMTIVDVVEEVREDIKSMLVRGGEEAKKKLLEFTNENVVDWIDARDNVNELFKGLIHEANKINAQVKVHQLMELNREMIDLIYQEYGIGD